MNAFVRKELRAILPALTLGVLVVVAPMALFAVVAGELSPDFPPGFLYFGLGLITLVLSTAAFGQEFSNGTFQSLLAQPVPRRRLWWTKAGIAGAGAVGILAVLLLAYRVFGLVAHWPALSVNVQLICVAILLTGFAGGLCATLLFRQELSAFCIATLLPGLISLITAKLLAAQPESTILAATLTVLAVYSIAAFLFAMRLFARMQDAQWTGGTIALPKWFGSSAETSVRPAFTRFRPLRSLVRKEFQSHHVSWMMGGALVVLHLAMVAVRKFQSGAPGTSHLLQAMGVCWFLLWIALPFLIGGMAVAEERKLGTLENLLSLPVSRRAQFCIKLAVAVFMALILCTILPLLIERIATAIGAHDGLAQLPFPFRAFAFLGAMTAGMTIVSIYASSLSRNTLHAIGTAFVLNLPLLALGTWVYGKAFFETNWGAFSLWDVPLIVDMALLTMVPLSLVLAWRNFGEVQVGASVWRRNAFAGVLGLGFVLAATWLIYNRTWENFEALEPQHGPARLSGPVRRNIHSVNLNQVLLLLPNGRAWFSTEMEWVYAASADGKNRSDIQDVVPRGGRFLELSNWVALANPNFYSDAFGVRSDGTLWRITLPRTRPPGPGIHTNAIPGCEQLGSETNWQTIVRGGGYVLALKNDGTLWGWGYNRDGALGAEPDKVTNDFIRVTQEADWKAVFAIWGTAIGVKDDGSVWKWGRLATLPQGEFNSASTFAPVRWNLNGSNWVERIGHSYDLTLHRDGTLWASGWIPPNTLGEAHRYAFVQTPQRIRSDRHWRDLAGDGNTLAAIDENGDLVYNDSNRTPLLGITGVQKPSKYSDWIAVEAQWDGVIALAADGTLTCWSSRNTDEGPARILGPTRKPAWSLNIFTPEKSTAAAARASR